MALDHTTPSFILPARMGRQAPLAKAVASLGMATLGQEGAVAANGMALTAPGLPLYAASGAVPDAAALRPVADRVLEAIGLRLVAVPDAGPGDPNLSLAALMLRVGLVGRILDLAHHHLKPRRSMGQKILSHQLVKVGFSDAYAAMRLAEETAALRLATGDMSGLDADHNRLTETTLAAEKLMGGHGYLLSGTHPLGYASVLIQTIYGPQP
ncbi:acyl-CoA dehydrogenase family protein [Defluviimonas denitrificans]|jgi:hypothetical protein|nr:acyl-CoA dehydrogenase family protein [Defluviimonas denitrificans]MCB1408070.1 hypothetical protein [Paracoccaceae bacterium]